MTRLQQFNEHSLGLPHQKRECGLLEDQRGLRRGQSVVQVRLLFSLSRGFLRHTIAQIALCQFIYILIIFFFI